MVKIMIKEIAEYYTELIAERSNTQSIHISGVVFEGGKYINVTTFTRKGKVYLKVTKPFVGLLQESSSSSKLKVHFLIARVVAGLQLRDDLVNTDIAASIVKFLGVGNLFDLGEEIINNFIGSFMPDGVDESVEGLVELSLEVLKSKTVYGDVFESVEKVAIKKDLDKCLKIVSNLREIRLDVVATQLINNSRYFSTPLNSKSNMFDLLGYYDSNEKRRILKKVDIAYPSKEVRMSFMYKYRYNPNVSVPYGLDKSGVGHLVLMYCKKYDISPRDFSRILIESYSESPIKLCWYSYWINGVVSLTRGDRFKGKAQ